MSDDMTEAFSAVLDAENAISDLKAQMAKLDEEKGLQERALSAAWERVSDLMAETGEYEVLIPGSAVDYKIAYSKPRETAKVEPDGVPDEFCKVERKPKLKEIGEHLKSLKDSGLPMPNWGRLESGVSKLTWKAIKKKGTGNAE